MISENYSIKEVPMYYQNKFYSVFILTAIFMLFGCVAKTQLTTIKKPIESKLSSYNVFKIEPFIYDSSVEIDDQMKADQLKGMFQERVKYNIYNLSLFERVIENDPVKTGDRVVMLKGRITYMKRVTKTTRIMFGAMAGRAGVGVDIQLVDATTKTILGEANIQGTSSGGSVFAGGTEEAFENAAQQITDFIKNNY
jgi:Domain of unknown function (DUF4410)